MAKQDRTAVRKTGIPNLEKLILAFDTHYTGTKAKTACIAFENWTDETPADIYTQTTEDFADYEPGALYKRELPCILNLLKEIPISNISCIVVDGFVQLDDFGKLGLGGHLYEALDGKIPVIGVAKSKFWSAHKTSLELYRGGSKKPLYISAMGIEKSVARELVKSMAGDYRIPKLLKLLDRKTREA